MKYFKEGQTVYHQINGEGVVIDSYWYKCVLVSFRDCVDKFTEDGRYGEFGPIVLSQLPIKPIENVPLSIESELEEYKFEPFSYIDAEYLIGRTIKSKNKESFEIAIIERVTAKHVNRQYSFQQLFEYWTFLDGKPCGRLVSRIKHLETEEETIKLK